MTDQQPFDAQYWGQFGLPAKVDVSRWGNECKRGCAYHVRGVDNGGRGQVRKISTGRKARGYASGTDGKL